MEGLDIDKLRAERCKRSFYHFFLDFWEVISTEQLVDNWHIKIICDELQVMGERIKDRLPKLHDLIINVPPGSSKSSIASQAFPAWLWTIDPSIRIISGSHGQGLSLSMAVKSRDIIQSDKYKRYYPEIILKSDSNNKSNYSNNHNGQRIATSVGSGIIGNHAHIHLVDDPLNLDPSVTEIMGANNWIDSLSTRKVSKEITPLILIMQRLADNDTCAYILKKNKNVKVISLPAELTEKTTPEYRKYYKDGLFDPIRISRQVIENTKVDLGSYKYESQFLQNPSPTEGGIVKHEWIDLRELRYSDTASELHKEVFDPSNDIDLYVDTALTENEANDPSAIVVTSYNKKLNKLFVIKAVEFWMEFSDLVRLIEVMGVLFGNRSSKIYIEPKANGHSVVQYMKKNSNLNVILDKAPTESKDSRLTGISPFIESGKVVFIKLDNDLPSHPKLNVNNIDELITEITSVKPSRYGVRDCLIMAVQNKMKGSKKGSYAIR